MPKRTFNIKLKDGTYELHYDNAALYEFEEIHKDTAINVISKGEMGFRAITNFVYAGLLHGEDRLHIEQVKQMIPLKDLQRVVIAIEAAMNDAFDDGSKKKPAKKPKAGQQK